METILVVDDDKEIARLVRSYLEKAGYDVLSTHTGETALHMLRRERPDVLILDLMLPDRDGWDITRIIRADENLAATPIIMLTARIEENDKVVGLEMGADDYITKPFNPREVVARVRALLRRSHLERDSSRPEILKVHDLHMDVNRRTLSSAGTLVELTPTEFEILYVLMKNPGYVFTREELLEKSVGYTYEGIGRTLDSHIKNLRRKIEPNSNNPSYIQTVYGIGYRLLEPSI